ncbi:amino acid adenylation domain-containing protein [Sorangium sp. So ce861]|uniref:amino acid adenylation domain-containing protein n=1 Tax=Sorangium sp. So ce861 TaxID=3133323 RepID=UPI003F5FCA6F
MDWIEIHARDRAGAPGLRFIEQDGGERRLDYAGIAARARALAAALQARWSPGDKALILLPSGLDYVSALLGCFYAGIVAVPVNLQSARRVKRVLPKISAIAADCRPALALTSAEVERASGADLGAFVRDNALELAVLDRTAGDPDGWTRPALDATSLAFLQYTSGSTGAPKGVVNRHGPLLANLEFLSGLTRPREGTVIASWLPLFHDMGLILGILSPLAHGNQAVYMSPAAFIADPLRWLEVASEARATVLPFPSFALRLCAEEARKADPARLARIDLSSVESVVAAAEPVLADHVDLFHEAFGPLGLRIEAIKPSYGLAEATVAASISSADEPPLYLDVDTAALERGEVVVAAAPGAGTRRYVGNGRDFGGQDLRIVDPETRRTLPPGRVGEIWMSGPALASGYWNKPEETAATFGARTAEPEDDRAYLRTGDMGFLHEGALFITGRLKEMMIFRGQCHYPNDIEATAAAAHPAGAAGRGAAFSLEHEGEERLVVVQEVMHRAGTDYAAVASEIRAAVAEHNQLAARDVVLIRKGTLPRTTSGKVQRREARRAYLAGELAAVWIDKGGARPNEAAPAGPDRLSSLRELAGAARRERLAARIAELAAAALGTVAARAVDLDASLFSYGLDSVTAARLAVELTRELGIGLPENLLFDQPSARALASWLCRELVAHGALPPAEEAPARTSSGRAPGASRASGREPIAIVGMAFRLPGLHGEDAETDGAFWELLSRGGSAVRPMPASRFRASDDFPGFGAFLGRVDAFDAAFFGMSPREAINTDPQQRMLLEVAWHALEDAGLRPAALRGGDTGVFIGIGTGDYAHIPFITGDPAHFDAYYGTGNSFAAACGRLSFFFGWEGPSMAVDTACSASHSAVHLACQSLRLGECGVALAGGVKLQLQPEIDLVLHKAGMLAPDGLCKTLDARADGYVRGEGCGVLVLKRLSDALASGDPIRAVILDTIVRQDGGSGSLSAPSGEAQRRMLTLALSRAGVSPHDIDYVELHGTGTRLGDPIEYQSVAAVFRGRPADDPLALGSVKTNIGHLEAAAGVAGLIKTVLALEHGMIPPHLHLSAVNPMVDLAAIPAVVPTALTPWPRRRGLRRAGVTSYGFAGTIAHVLLEEAEAPREAAAPEDAGGPRVFLLSARSGDALRRLAQGYRALLETRTEADVPLAALSNGMARHREHLPLRLALVAEDRAGLAAALERATFPGDAVARPPRVGFLFTGQGAQFAGMGRALYAAEAAFRAALDEADAALAPHLGRSIRALMHEDDGGLLQQTGHAQPALFAFGYALARLWLSWGVRPAAMVGHSIGEFAAMVIAGALSLEDAARLIARRGALMQALPPGGGMLAARISGEEASALAQGCADRVSVAAVNGPLDAVLSGDIEALRAIAAALQARGVSARPLAVSHAFHSPLMDPMLDAWAACCGNACGAAARPRIPVFSTLTGAALEAPPDATYFRAHARQAVRFAEALRRAAAECDVLLEIGPHTVLTAIARRNQLDERWSHRVECVASLRRGADDRACVREATAELYARGQDFDWGAAFAGPAVSPRLLPRYPFERQGYWLDYDEDAPRRPLPLQPQPERAAPRATDLYTVAWEELAPEPGSLAGSRWRLVGGAEAIAGPLAAELLSLGADVTRHPAGGFAALAGEVGPDDTIVYLPALDLDAARELDGGRASAGVWALVELTRALQQARATPRIVLPTLGGQSVAGEPCEPLRAGLWGAARALSIEYPGARWLMIDLDPAEPAARLGDHLPRIPGLFASEDAVAVRAGAWLRPRLAPSDQESHPAVATAPPPRLRDDRIYLVAGAYGALGQHIVEWLAGRGARHLVLVGRRPASAGVLARLAHLRAGGARLDCRSADIADEASIARLFEDIASLEAETGRRLGGVIHCAGVGRFNPLEQITRDDYAAVAGAKMTGTWLLHQHTRGRDLDWFVCCTSISGIWGSRMQIHYGAANAFQDALVRLRRAEGLPALAIAWGPWGGGAGMSEVDETLLNYLRTAGVKRLAPARYLATLDLLAGAAGRAPELPPVWVVADVDWSKFVPLMGLYSHTGMFARCSARLPAPSLAAGGARERLELAQLAPEARERAVAEFVAAELARVLRVAPERVVPDGELLSLGMDSILVMDFARVCEAALGVQCELKAVFERGTPRRLAAYLCERLATRARGEAPRAPDERGASRITPDRERRHEPFPLTELQYAYWVGRHDHHALGGVACHAYMEVDARRGVDLRLLERCWNLLIARHDALRIVIGEDGRQRFLPSAPAYEIRVEDLEAAPRDVAEARCASLREELSHHVLDPSAWPLFDLRAARLPGGGVRLFISIDMLINDATSSQVLWEELLALYQAGGDLAAAGLAPFEISFRDYVEAKVRRDPARQAAWEAARAFWLGKLADLPPAPQLPLRHEAMRAARPRFTRWQHRLEAGAWQRLRERAGRHGSTAASLLIAAFAEVLAAFSAEPRFSLNLTTFDRLPWHPDVARLVGDFTAVTLLPLDLGGELPFGQRAAAVNGAVLEHLEHRAFSAVDLLREWNRGRERRDLVTMPVVFTSQLGMSDPTKGAAPDNPLGEVVYGVSQTPQVWLDHQACELEGALISTWDAVGELFPPGLVDAMFAAYTGLLARLAEDEAAWSAPPPPMLPPAQRETRARVNATAGPTPERCLDQLFFDQAAAAPDRVALIAGGRSLRYGDVARWSCRLAHALRAEGVARGERVAVAMRKGPEQVAACLAIQAAGAAYVPVDADAPAPRLLAILAGSGARVVLTQPDCLVQVAERAAPSGARALSADEDSVARFADTPPEIERELTDLAYVIYTSGSTGTPKGVLIDHRGAANTVLDVNRRFGVGASDRALGVSSLSFDLSVYDIFGILAAGGALVLPDPEGTRDPARWLELVERHGVTLWNSVPALLELLLDEAAASGRALAGLRHVFLSGDWIPLRLPARLAALSPAAKLIAMGGATEASIWSNWFAVEGVPPEWTSIPYGYPLTNQRYRVLDSRLRDCPDHVTGDLHIGGIGLALGYEGDPERTAASFFHHPGDGERLYRTGDIARYWADGTIEFLGRRDLQVKIAGNRIELGEIESALSQHPGVREAVVDAIGPARGERRLAAWVVPQPGDPTVFEPLACDPAESLAAWSAMVEAAEGSLAAAPPGEAVEGFWALMDVLGLRMMRDTLAEAGVAPAAPREEALRALAPAPAFAALAGRWLDAAALAGPELEADADGAWQALLAEAERFGLPRSALIRLRAGAAARLRVLRAEADALELFYGADDTIAPEQLTQMNPLTPTLTAALAAAVRAAAQAAGGRPCVLEIGARTGVAARELLRRLDGCPVVYTVSDASRLLVDAARDTLATALAGAPHAVEFRVFDPEQPAGWQGAPEHVYDVVIAVNALHRSRDVAGLLSRCKALLRPGGLLLAPEMTRNSLFQLATVALLEKGYTGLADARSETGLPLLSAATWRRELARAGFAAEGAFSVAGVADPGLHLLAARHPDVAARFAPRRLVEHLASILPGYMVPQTIFQLDRLPLSATGKVARGALPRPERTASVASRPAAALTGIEAELARVWQDLLGLQQVGPDDNFFELGGDSLVAVRMIEAVRHQLKANVALRDLFEAPTLGGLAARAAQAGPYQDALPALRPDPARRFDPFPLTDVQQAYWIGRQASLELGGVSTHIYVEIEVEGLSVAALEAAWQALTARHDMLRAVIDERGMQRILEDVPRYAIARRDLRGMSEGETAHELDLVRLELSHAVRDTGIWPMFEVRAAQMADDRVRLFISLDNLICDGRSMVLLLSEWAALARRPDTALPPLSASFRDYVLLSEQIAALPAHQRALGYWLGRLEELRPGPALPLAAREGAPPPAAPPRFSRREARLPAPGWQALRALAAEAGVTPNALLLAAYGEVLAHFSAEPRFTLNLTLFHRPPVHAEIDQLVGDFTSLVLLAFDGAGELPFAERARAVQRQLWADLEHAQVSAVRVLREAARRRGRLVQVAVPVVFTSGLGVDAVDATRGDGAAADGLGELVYGVSQTPQVWIDQQVVERRGALVFSWDAVDAVFPAGLLDAMFAAYCDLLVALSAGKDAWAEPARARMPPNAWAAALGARAAEAPPAPPARVDGPLIEDEIYEAVRDAIAELTGVARSSPQASFFELGLTSLGLIRLRQQLQARLSVEIPVVEMFNRGSAAALSAYLRGAPGGAPRERPGARSASRLDNARRRKRQQQL